MFWGWLLGAWEKRWPAVYEMEMPECHLPSMEEGIKRPVIKNAFVR